MPSCLECPQLPSFIVLSLTDRPFPALPPLSSPPVPVESGAGALLFEKVASSTAALQRTHSSLSKSPPQMDTNPEHLNALQIGIMQYQQSTGVHVMMAAAF